MKLVLIRHGESEWNLENRFTGWKDVDLSPKGIEEAKSAGKILKEMNLVFDVAYTSYLKRAIKTLNIVLEEMDIPYGAVAYALVEDLVVFVDLDKRGDGY